MNGTLPDSSVSREAVVGYYRQDFSTMDPEETVLKTLVASSGGKHKETDVRKVAASFFIDGDVDKQKIASLSEGQKGLVSFACLVLKEPGILIVDEPTNHINFR